MEKKYSVTLSEEFVKYCRLNGIEDVEGRATQLFEQAFTTLKYGTSPIVKVLMPEDHPEADEKPTPPPSQVIKEGHDPVPKTVVNVPSQPNVAQPAKPKPKKDIYGDD